MAIDSYSALRTAIITWTHRQDLGAAIDDFIDLTENRLNRDLRVSQMEVRATAPADSEYLALPTDFLALRNIQLNTSPVRELVFVAPAEMDRLADNDNTLVRYTIVGDEIQLNATSSYSLEISYYAKIPALDDTNTTNWVIDTHPDVYLYGCLAEAFSYIQNDEQAMKYMNLFMDGMEQIKRLDRDRRYGQSMWVRVA
jgi:hypothetical protein